MGCSPWGHKESDTTGQLNSKTFAGFLSKDGVSLVAQTVTRLPAMQETRVRSLGWEVPLKKGLAPHSNILAWRIPWTEEPGGLQAMGSQ